MIQGRRYLKTISELNYDADALESKIELGIATEKDRERFGKLGRFIGLDSEHAMYCPSRVRFNDSKVKDISDPAIQEWLKEPSDADYRPVQWESVDGILTAVYNGCKLVRAPQYGSQMKFVQSPIYETIIEGNRGGGKTDSGLMRYAQHVGKGYGAMWVGIIFRNTVPQLGDVIKKSNEIFPALFGPEGASYNQNQKCWTFPGGEKLYFRHINRIEHYRDYHGWEVPFMHFEELTSWADDKCYKNGMSLSRCKNPEVPLIYGGSTNPSGIGHNWVKKRFRLPIPKGRVIGQVLQDINEEGSRSPFRVAIHSEFSENRVLSESNPDYLDIVCSAATSAQQVAAWKHGSWAIVSGGMFDDLWEEKHHIVRGFKIKGIPSSWRVYRAYDHGQSRPFSVGWWAVSNGEVMKIADKKYGSVPGDVFRIAEWYGCGHSDNEGLNMSADDIALGILAREREMGLAGRVRVGTADSAIFDDYQPGKSVAGDMQKKGVRWYPADKGPGSRIQGWQQIRLYLKNALPVVGGTRENPGMFISEHCVDFLRTMPVLPRDARKSDDVDTQSEDHIGDETRYFLRMKDQTAQQWSF